jgi:hypothetical protein
MTMYHECIHVEAKSAHVDTGENPLKALVKILFNETTGGKRQE